MVGRSVVSHAAGKSSDSLPGCSTFADWLFAMNITLQISKVSFIWQRLLSCCAIYEMASSLIESNEVKSEHTIEVLKDLIEKDIKARLSKGRLRKFYLHKALFELHTKINKVEKLSAIISLNYDRVVDGAYNAINGKPNYCL